MEDKVFKAIRKADLFNGINDDDLREVLIELDGKLRKYKKNDYIFLQGEEIKSLNLIIEGKVQLQKEDYWGNRRITNVMYQSCIFGEAFVFSNDKKTIVDALAVEDTIVYSILGSKLIEISIKDDRIIKNLLKSISDKVKFLAAKINSMSKKDIKSKLMSYLSEESKKYGSSTFTIPFNRQQLADFLSVDRSAMSTILGKMKKEGLIDFKKNNFTLRNRMMDREIY